MRDKQKTDNNKKQTKHKKVGQGKDSKEQGCRGMTRKTQQKDKADITSNKNKPKHKKQNKSHNEDYK